MAERTLMNPQPGFHGVPFRLSNGMNPTIWYVTNPLYPSKSERQMLAWKCPFGEHGHPERTGLFSSFAWHWVQDMKQTSWERFLDVGVFVDEQEEEDVACPLEA